jgi:Zn-dependent protease with chaperone function
VATRLGLAGRLDLVDLAVPVAFCYGYLRPRVLVSTGLVELLPPRELEALLLHEREHLRQRDPLKVAAGKLLAASTFFVPLLTALYRRFLVEKELAADRAAIREQAGAASLSAALLRLLEQQAPGSPAFGAGSSDALEARLDALLGSPRRLAAPLGFRQLAASLIVALLAVLPLFAWPLQVDAHEENRPLVADCHFAT